MFEILNRQSPPTAMVVFVVGGVLLFCVSSIVVRPILRLVRARERDLNVVAGAVLSCFGVFYSLLLGLLAVAAYQEYDDAENRVTDEASLIVGVYGDIFAYPAPIRNELHVLLRDYVSVTIDKDWSDQRDGRIPVAGSEAMRKFLLTLFAFQPKNAGEEVLHASVVTQCAQLRDIRRHRMFATNGGLPPVLWFVVLIGGVLNLVLLCLLDMHYSNQLLLGGIVSAFLGSVICVLVLMDKPFRGPIAIDSEPFRIVLEMGMQQL